MMRRYILGLLALSIIVGTSSAMSQQLSDRRADAGSAEDEREIVLFPFDTHGIPLSYGLTYDLIQGHRQGVVVRPAAKGADAQHIISHGSVFKVGDEFRMWYLCVGDRDASITGGSKLPVDLDKPRLDNEGRGAKENILVRICYATSKDGITWKKPNLGLATYGGNKKNNLVDFPIGDYRFVNLIVIEDATDPDPSRRFKMAFQSVKYQSRVGVAFSADGFHWKEYSANPVTQHMVEIHGLTKFNGAYYVNGHGGSPRPGPNAIMPRRMVTYMSYDFEHWADATALSFDRFPGSEIPKPYRGHAGEQIHTGASLWNRGNVIIGFYGMWHGDISDDRKLVTMDLGLVVSDDALEFKEPIKDFRIIAANEEAEIVTHTIFTRLGDAGGGSLFGLALTQGQGWMNVGDQTLYWYTVWSQGRVRLATWARDRLGYFEVPMEIRRRQQPSQRVVLKGEQGGITKAPEPTSPWAKVSPHFVSMPIALDNAEQRVFVNADGLSDKTYLKVEILDEKFNVLAGYSRDDCAPITESGFREPAVFGGKTTLQSAQPIRVRVSIEGERPEDVRIYATYVATK